MSKSILTQKPPLQAEAMGSSLLGSGIQGEITRYTVAGIFSYLVARLLLFDLLKPVKKAHYEEEFRSLKVTTLLPSVLVRTEAFSQ